MCIRDSSLTPSPEEDSIQIREADILAEEKVPGEEQSQIAPDIVQALLVELMESQQLSLIHI